MRKSKKLLKKLQESYSGKLMFSSDFFLTVTQFNCASTMLEYEDSLLPVRFVLHILVWHWNVIYEHRRSTAP